MLPKRQIKIITSLHQKKCRKREGIFVAEGRKVIKELLNSNYELEMIYSTDALLFSEETKVTIITEAALKKISFLKTPNAALAVFKIEKSKIKTASELTVVLDDVRDPGNLGTIIRLCDWFGVTKLVCSKTTVDCYNPKVVQATMGSLARVEILYTDLETYLDKATVPIYGAFMDGKNVYTTTLTTKGILVMGNEANGISEAVQRKITDSISIPRFGTLQETESLNVATASAILLSEFKRNTIEM